MQKLFELASVQTVDQDWIEAQAEVLERKVVLIANLVLEHDNVMQFLPPVAQQSGRRYAAHLREAASDFASEARDLRAKLAP